MWRWDDGSDALMHYGIKGQKWGVRRFQNPDGTLTALGRHRYGLGMAKTSKSMTSKEKRNKARAKTEYGEGHSKKTSNYQRRKMSSESLKKRAERLRLEKEVKNLEKEVNATGHEWVSDALKSVAKKTAVQMGASIAISVALQWLSTGSVDLTKVRIPTPKDQW